MDDTVSMIVQHSSPRVGADYDIETTAAVDDDRDAMGDTYNLSGGIHSGGGDDDFDTSGMLGLSSSSSSSSSSPPQQQLQLQQQPPIASRVQIQFSLPLREDGNDNVPFKSRATAETTTTRTTTNPLGNGDQVQQQLLNIDTDTTTNDNDNDDNTDDDNDTITSITSIPYFDPTDFKPANWDNISDHAPTIGFALFGLAMALTHPVFFMAGLATALGTATAASRGYDCFVDGTCGLGITSATTTSSSTRTCSNDATASTSTANGIYDSWFGSTELTEQAAAAAAAAAATAAGVVNPAPLLDKTLVDHPPPPTVVLPESEQPQMLNSVESSNTPALILHQEDEKQQQQQRHGPSAVLPVDRRISSTGSSSSTTTTTDTAEEQQEHDTKPTGTTTNTTAAATITHRHYHSLKRTLPTRDTEKDAIMSWWKQQYPPLKNTIIQDQCFVGLNVAEFFRVFFSDHAPYNFQEFQVKRGDRNITYGTWTPVRFDPSHRLQQNEPLSMHPDATATTTESSLYCDYHSYQTRTLNFQAKTNNGLLGPAYATTTKTQRWMMVSKRFAVLESKTVLHNIPFCDKFFVMERWYLHATKSNHNDHDISNSNGNWNLNSTYYTTQLTVTAGVYFVDTCPFETAIRSKSATAIREVVTAWTAMALQALELTKQAKLDRLSKSCSESSPRHFSIRGGPLRDGIGEDNDTDEGDENQQDIHNGQDAGNDSTDDIEVQYSASSTFSNGNNSQPVSLVRSETEPVKKKRSVLVGLRRSLSNMVAYNKQKQYQQQQPGKV